MIHTKNGSPNIFMKKAITNRLLKKSYFAFSEKTNFEIGPFALLMTICPSDISTNFKLVYQKKSDHSTKNTILNQLSRPCARTTSFGLNSTKYQSILNWNFLQQNYPQYDLKSLRLNKLKQICKSTLVNYNKFNLFVT